jgi:hypothetical protein
MGMFATIFAGYFSELTVNYDTASYYNSSEIALFNKTAEINENAEAINRTLTTIENGNAVDVIGGLLTSGYTVLKTTWSSFGVYTAVVKDAGTMVNAGQATSSLIVSLSLIGFLLLMFALIAILTGRDSV